MPFDIPDNWTWIRFPNLVNFILGKTPERHNPKYWNDGKYPWFSIADMKDKQIIFETKEKISECSLNENFSSSLTPAGTLIMSFKLTVGRVSILGVNAIHNEAIISIFPYLTENNTIRDWLFYTLGLIVEYVDHTDAIKGSTLNKQKMNAMLIPLPPLREQNRIITKLLETKPLIDKYNDTEVKLSVLEQEFPDRLKKSILQYAIEGKLVKQDPNDEPASVLLDHIKAEKEKLIKEGKIKRNKNESYIYQGDDKNYYEKTDNSEPIKLEDLPFDIPYNWLWIRFPNLVNFVLGKTPERHNPKYWNDGKYPWFSIADMKDKKTVYETKEKVSECSLIEKFNSSLSPAGTLIMSFKLTVGRVSILGIDAIHNEAIISIFPYLNANNSIRDWLFYALGLIVEYVDQTDAIKGSTLNKEKMNSMLIPLPPLNEQKRIVNKLDIILKKIDDLI